MDPGRLDLEPSIGVEVGRELEQMGHAVRWWDQPTYLAGSVCTILSDTDRRLMTAGADFRRTSYALGW
jgi:gamma-glutamyltranspeptidase/glutathione hydrolase